MSTEVMKTKDTAVVPFNNEEILSAIGEDNVVYIPMKRLCQNLEACQHSKE